MVLNNKTMLTRLGWSRNEDATEVCQEVVEDVLLPIREVGAALTSAATQYFSLLSDHGCAEVPDCTNSKSNKALLTALNDDATKRLCEQRPSVSVFNVASLGVVRFLGGDHASKDLLGPLDPIVVAAMAVREACSRARPVSEHLDEKLVFDKADSRKERNKKRRALAALAKSSDRCKLLFVTFSNLKALCDGSQPTFQSYDQKDKQNRFSRAVRRRGADGLLSHKSSSCDSVPSCTSTITEDAEFEEDRLDSLAQHNLQRRQMKRHMQRKHMQQLHETSDENLHYWRTNSYDDFLQDVGPVQF